MSKKNFLGAEGLEGVELLPVPAPPTTGETRENGASVSALAQERMPAFGRGEQAVSSVRRGRKLGLSGYGSALGFGLLLLTSMAACLERLAWMGGH